MTKKSREVNTSDIGYAIEQMIREASFDLGPDVESLFSDIMQKENKVLPGETMHIILDNARIAREEHVPLCQDCGSVTVFIELGQQVQLIGSLLEDAVNDAVSRAYDSLYLRKSIVADPLRRVNTGTNTPAFIHGDIVAGNRVKIYLYLKGGGSENMTDVHMFRPTDPVEDIIAYIASAVKQAGPNPCPPLFLGVGIGGTADVAVINSRRAVMRGLGSVHPDPFYADLETRILEEVNRTGVGPLGFGGNTTAAAVFIREAPCHIATLPVALNMNCHSLRYRTVEL